MKPLVIFGDVHKFPKSDLHAALTHCGIRWIDGNRLRAPRDGVYLAWEKYPKLRIRSQYWRVIGRRPLLNEGFDTSKTLVEIKHHEVFGYSMGMDPRTYHGEGVRKSKKNARHDGVVVRMPIAEPMPTKVYQILIDNRINDREVEDIRLVLLQGRPVACYLKRRLIEERFLNTLTSAELVDPYDVLSGDELNRIGDFAAAMGADYGGFDILRDRKTEKIYVVDANGTPRGPPKALSELESARALEQIGAAFAALLDR